MLSVKKPGLRAAVEEVKGSKKAILRALKAGEVQDEAQKKPRELVRTIREDGRRLKGRQRASLMMKEKADIQKTKEPEKAVAEKAVPEEAVNLKKVTRPGRKVAPEEVGDLRKTDLKAVVEKAVGLKKAAAEKDRLVKEPAAIKAAVKAAEVAKVAAKAAEESSVIKDVVDPRGGRVLLGATTSLTYNAKNTVHKNIH